MKKFPVNSGQLEKVRVFLRTEAFQKFLALAFSVVSASALARYNGLSTANILTLLLIVFMIPMYRAAFRIKSKKIGIMSLICGLFFAGATILFKFEWLTLQTEHRALYIFEFIVGLLSLFSAFSAVLAEHFSHIRLNTPGKEPSMHSKRIVFLWSGLLIFACWLPYFLMLYPGDITADSISELNQAVKDEPLSNHHPIVHTMMIRICYNLGFALFHDETKAVATYSVIQMLFMAFGFAYLIETMYKYRVKKLPIFCVLFCFCFLSYHGVYSVAMWKDIMFGFFVLTFTTTLWRVLMYDLRGEKKLPIREPIMLFLTGIGVCLFRSNGMYAYIMMLVFLIIFCIKCKKFVIMSVTCAALIVAAVVKGPVYNSLNITPPDTIEGLAIPQQMISAVVSHERELTDEQRELIERVLSLEDIRSCYSPNSADPVKLAIRDRGDQEYLAEHKGEYLKLWMQLGAKYPSDYVIAFVYSTIGYWLPDVRNWVYAGEFRWDNFETLRKKPLISEENVQFLDRLRNSYTVYYVLGLFWSIALEVWVALFMMGVTFVKRKPRMLLLYLPIFGVWGTLLLAAPVFAEFRYTYSIFCTVPLLCIVPFVSTEGIRSRQSPAAAVSTEAKTEAPADTPTKAQDETPAEAPNEVPAEAPAEKLD